jgi:hypothetical protein
MTFALPAVAVNPVGAVGADTGRTGVAVAWLEAADSPLVFTAVTT